MGLVRIAAPATEPVTVAEAAAHLRLDSVNFEPVPDAPLVVLTLRQDLGTGVVDVGLHRYRVTFVTASGETNGGDESAAFYINSPASDWNVSVRLPLGGSAVIARKLYRTSANGSTYYLVATIADNATTTYVDTAADAQLGAEVPSTNTTGDPFVGALITAAREYAETFTRRAFITQRWRLQLDGAFPCSDLILLPRPNLLSVETVTYVDSNGNTVALDPTIYSVDPIALPGRIILDYGQYWPFPRTQRNAVTIEYTAGYGAATAVPQSIKQALLLLVGNWYANREAFIEARFMNEVPFAVDALLWQHRYLEP